MAPPKAPATSGRPSRTERRSTPTSHLRLRGPRAWRWSGGARCGWSGGFEGRFVVADVVVEANENLAGLVGHDGDLVIGSGECADGVQTVEVRQGNELGLAAGRPPQQPRALEPGHTPKHT